MNENKLTKNPKNKKKFNTILNQNPNNYQALLKLGLADIKEKNYSNAKEKFYRLIKLDNKKYEAHLNLSNIYFLEADVPKANNILTNYLENIKENVEIINSLAINFFNSNDYKNLETHISKYINNYQSYILYYLKGFLLLQADKINKSENFFKKSIALNASFWNSYDFLLNQYDKQSKLKDFIFLFKAAKKISCHSKQFIVS